MESDSDTWEDFFGSSTELAHSLLGFYDTLTNTLSAGPTATKADSSGSSQSSGESTPKRSNSNCSTTSSTTSTTSNNSNNSSDNHSGSYSLDGGAQTPLVVAGLRDDVADGVQLSRLVVQRRQELGSNHSISSTASSNHSRRGNNIRVLSPNVQRIITHADAEPVNAIDIEAIQQQQQLQQTHSLPGQRSPTPLRYAKAATTAPPKLKLSHLPLSKTTGKLSTQSGSDLVSTLDAGSDYVGGAHRKANSSADEDKTPTNKAAPGTPFHFEGNPFSKLKLQSIKLSEMEQLAVTSRQLATAPPPTPPAAQAPAPAPAPGAASTPVPPPRHKAFVVASEPLSPEPFVDAINFNLVAQHIEKLTLSDLDLGEGEEAAEQLVEAINKPLIGKPLVRSVSAPRASQSGSAGPSSPLQTYARTKLKSQSGKASTLGGGMPLRLPTAEQLAELEEANKLSAESLDTLTDIKPKYPPRLSELTRLNNRPLSSSSICSTSSSSSSGSDQLLNGKLAATSYLASVESLAESENELGDHHHHHHPSHTNPMSVLERACLEIVDSERSFVEDLGQVIKGYLLDWKERACLRTDELQILFANIEEIYEFNSLLLQQLINSGMDPGRIAKCFIDLRDRFNVYTTYCTSYPEAISLLTKLLQAKHTNTLLASTQTLLQHRLPLGSYLLKPVQRILKYHLLLDSLRKHCDVKEVAEAYAIMRQVAHHIDQVKRQQEQQSRVKELSGILDGWMGPDLSVLRELRHEGLLMEQHNKPRQVLLFETMLIITKQKEDGRLQFKSLITQKNLMLSEHLPGEPTSFYVIPFDDPRNQIKLTARNRDQKRIWTQHIKDVMLQELDIPTRAKELVYQLGNEEDRTPDRSTWKWSLNSSSNSTPTYLERRNACRRSEIRLRNSKFKRKTLTNSSSVDSFNESLEQPSPEQAAAAGVATKPAKPLSRNNSLDDTALQKLAAAVRYRNKRDSKSSASKEPCKCEAQQQQQQEQEQCGCILREQRSRTKSQSPVFSYKALKERSKSVPRISGFSLDEQQQREADDDSAASLRGSKPDLSERKAKAKGFFEVKQYNHKTMPKRIANLKKQRGSCGGSGGIRKESCSTFYMDLSEFDSSAVLKITESTEDLELAEEAQETKVEQYYDCQQEAQPTPAEKAKRDAEIVLDLLKNTKEFERIYNKNKQQKQRRDSSQATTPLSPSPEEAPPLPPRPPSRSPPPLEAEQLQQQKQEQEQEEEPIYETLLRNVHVPYKFSPVLGRAKSVQYFKKRTPAPRPESDYVTLVYSPEGVLQRVGEDAVQQQQQQEQRDSTGSESSSGSTVKRDSQSTVINLSLESSNSEADQIDALYARPIPKNLVKRLLNGNSTSGGQNVSHSEISLLPRALKSIDNLSMAFGRTPNRPPERRVSDVSEMCRQSILHRQGSEAVGERMAHVDYADPKTLFSIIASSEASLQRDSVFSLTSSSCTSSDSMCDQQRKRSATELPASGFEYEQHVEDSLENDFRDSAIYSDDNNEKRSTDYDVKRPRSPPPPPPANGCERHPSPPQIAPKPTKPTLQELLGQHHPSVVICPPHLSQAASRSWVLQQIENFNK
ncbi:PREDICTED: uncharacterized protein LOC108615559 isoform X1 [Drosophila arizonae]|uniref:Uncharacterized protein LOC108615559 isoform X1 n=1 Tax=Drosophila arizonae TaxID=7263 RepID=A0ABM1PEG7_DROAR|nr:PREDICTED: uncharacterized protein LOC108615559 isoform X1 [Drosophila arizonae]